MIESILMALAGGALIGLAASAMLFFVGRIAGISGIYGGLLKPSTDNNQWRVAFMAGLLVGGGILMAFAPQVFQAPAGHSWMSIAVAGVLVGFGVRMGNGCTSGHGVCGLTRFSGRSLVATLTFMGTGVATATIVHLLTGGVL